MCSIYKLRNWYRLYRNGIVGPQRTTRWLLLVPIDTEKVCSNINDVKVISNEKRRISHTRM